MVKPRWCGGDLDRLESLQPGLAVDQRQCGEVVAV